MRTTDEELVRRILKQYRLTGSHRRADVARELRAHLEDLIQMRGGTVFQTAIWSANRLGSRGIGLTLTPVNRLNGQLRPLSDDSK